MLASVDFFMSTQVNISHRLQGQLDDEDNFVQFEKIMVM